MFTGIVEEIGRIDKVERGLHSIKVSVQARKILNDLQLGDSVALNGVCLTVTSFCRDIFTADIMHETLKRSSLFDLTTGSLVNLERAMPVNGRFGGHIVSGHIDGLGKIIRIQKDDIAHWYHIKAEEAVQKYIVEKGSIAIDGISLTVAKVAKDHFSISVIPHTAQKTILSTKVIGDFVNLENDLIGKYVEKLMYYDTKVRTDSNITRDFLNKFGY